MQEVLRTACDSYLDSVDAGITTDVPFVFTIPKGSSSLVERLRRDN